MLATKITNHTAQAQARLMYQYQGQPRIEGLLKAFVDQIQDLEDVIFSLDDGQSVLGSIGKQLDGIGQIVGIERNGLDDTSYLLFILGKIGENTSDTTITKVHDIYALLLNSNIVQVQDLPPAEVGLSGGGSIDPSLSAIVHALIQGSLGAGIDLGFLVTFDPEEAFAFDGSAGTALGFGDVNDPLAGGEFAQVI